MTRRVLSPTYRKEKAIGVTLKDDRGAMWMKKIALRVECPWTRRHAFLRLWKSSILHVIPSVGAHVNSDAPSFNFSDGRPSISSDHSKLVRVERYGSYSERAMSRVWQARLSVALIYFYWQAANETTTLNSGQYEASIRNAI